MDNSLALFCVVALSTCAAHEGPADEEGCEPAPRTLGEARRRSRAAGYSPPAALEIARAEELFALLLAPPPAAGGDAAGAAQAAKAAAKAGALGFELHRVVEGGAAFLLLIEPAAAERGWGLYVFRPGGGSLAIEAPHAFEDLHTGAIAARLFLEGRAAAAAFSTAPRTAPAGDAGERADLAHLADGILHAFTRTFAAAHPRGVVLQVHGFDGERRQEPGRAPPEAILSNGTRSPPAWLLRAGDCLDAALAEPVAIFPHGTGELGGTTNEQGKLLRARGHGGFLHLEMGLALRLRLKVEPELRRQLLHCLPEKQE